MNLQLVSQDIHHTVAIFSQVFQGIYHLSLSHSMELPEKLATGGVKPASQTTAQSEKGSIAILKSEHLILYCALNL